MAKPIKSLKVKKKHWYEMVAPAIFNKKSIGKTLVGEPKEMLEKRISSNVMNLTGDIKKQYLIIKFKVISVSDGVGQTHIDKFWMMPASVKRLVRRNRDRIDLSFIAETKDKIKVRVKPLIITRNLTSAPTRTDLRNTTEKLLINEFKKQTFEQLIQNTIAGRVQSGAKHVLNKVYPLRLIDIRVLERVDSEA